MGLVKDRFTVHTYRVRGIASAIIAHCISHARALGIDDILIGSYARDTPKYLYQKLGFVPVCLTRHFVKTIEHPVGREDSPIY